MAVVDAMLDHDVVVVGAGPAGLSAALSLAKLGLRTAIIERQPLTAFANPKTDGRDIALTGRSRKLLTDLGVWDRFDAADISPIHAARVLNGNGAGILQFDAPAAGNEALGYLVSNHIIRRALYEAVADRREITFLAGQTVTDVRSDAATAAAILDSGELVRGGLLVAADSRFSEIRRMMGIAADTTPFGKTMLVFRATHEKPHQQTAYECFNYGHTLALLPLNGLRSSIVLTVPTSEAQRFIEMSDETLGAVITERFRHRFGAMVIDGGRFAYPLTGVYARHFVGRRFALIGDAAVGMHPVTAHGFNFGLLGQATLVEAIRQALDEGADIGGDDMLSLFEECHRRATRPLYLATNAIVRLYTNDSRPARVARSALLAVANRFAPAKHLIMSRLDQPAGGSSPTR